MSGTGEVREDFAGEERTFRIRLGEIRRIEEKAGIGIGEVARRLARCVLVTSELGGLQGLAAGVEMKSDDVRETIYQGLVGGGMSPSEATILVRRAIDDRGFRGLLEHATTAMKVLWGAHETPEEKDLGESVAGKPAETQKRKRTSASSTASASRSASARAKSTS